MNNIAKTTHAAFVREMRTILFHFEKTVVFHGSKMTNSDARRYLYEIENQDTLVEYTENESLFEIEFSANVSIDELQSLKSSLIKIAHKISSELKYYKEVFDIDEKDHINAEERDLINNNIAAAWVIVNSVVKMINKKKKEQNV